MWDPQSKYFTFRFDFSVYGTSFDVESVRKLEEMVSKAIAAKDDVERKICDSSDILSKEEVRKAFEEDHSLTFCFLPCFVQVVTVPGATYPETISVIEIAGVSAEPCAGTHLTNTGEVGVSNFWSISTFFHQVGVLVVTKCSTPATGLRSIRAVTGPEAESALKVSQEVDVQLSMLEKDLEEEKVEKLHSNKLEDVAKKLTEVKLKLEAPDFPLLVNHSIQTRLEILQKVIQVIFHIFITAKLLTYLNYTGGQEKAAGSWGRGADDEGNRRAERSTFLPTFTSP